MERRLSFLFILIALSLFALGGEAQVDASASKLQGRWRVTFKMTVDDRGHVTLTEIPTSTLPGGSDVESCMVNVLRDLRFPRGGGESTVSFQMSFGS